MKGRCIAERFTTFSLSFAPSVSVDLELELNTGLRAPSRTHWCVYFNE